MPWNCSAGISASQVKTGSIYAGLFHTANVANKDLDIVLKWARLVGDEPGSKAQAGSPVTKTLKIFSSDVVQISCLELGLGPNDLAPSGTRDADAFSTDAEIGRGRSGYDTVGSGSLETTVKTQLAYFGPFPPLILLAAVEGSCQVDREGVQQLYSDSGRTWLQSVVDHSTPTV